MNIPFQPSLDLEDIEEDLVQGEVPLPSRKSSEHIHNPQGTFVVGWSDSNGVYFRFYKHSASFCVNFNKRVNE